MNSVKGSSSLLAVEVGSITTRTLLFDTVEGRYRFLASGHSGSTAGAPMYDVGEGVRRSIINLNSISGRTFFNKKDDLIIPSKPTGEGIDGFASTLSAGQPLKVVAVGLLERVSLESVRHLVGTINSQIVLTIGLNDRQSVENKIDTVLRLRPDAIVIAGGTNNGASRSLLKLINTLGMAVKLIPRTQQPEILYAGNEVLANNVSESFEQSAYLTTVPNIRPGLIYEQLGPAEVRLADIYRKKKLSRILGIDDLHTWSGGHLMPTSTAFGRVIRFLSKIFDPTKGVLGINVGASSTTVAGAFAGKLKLKVFSRLGVGEGMNSILNHIKLENITRWIPIEVSSEYVTNYIFNKAFYPSTLPATPEDLAIEQAVAREILRETLEHANDIFPKNAARAIKSSLPLFDPILVSGSVITNAPTSAQSLLMILDGIQPTGITRLLLDNNNITPALGAAAPINAVLSVHVLESNAFTNLGYLISPTGNARKGSSVLRIKINYESGQENTIDIKRGTIQLIPLPVGRTAQLQLHPLQRSDIGMGGRGQGGKLRVIGGVFGIIIDARGRPIDLPNSPDKRRNQLIEWQQMIEAGK